jgi:hypothetical protein
MQKNVIRIVSAFALSVIGATARAQTCEATGGNCFYVDTHSGTGTGTFSDTFAATGDYEELAARMDNTSFNVLALSVHELILQVKAMQLRLGINGDAFGFRGRRQQGFVNESAYGRQIKRAA